MRTVLCFCLILFLGAEASAKSAVCPPAPITTKAQAVCIATQYLQREWPANTDWPKLQATAVKENSAWVVRFMETRSNIRGGGGELTLDTGSGKVTGRLMYK